MENEFEVTYHVSDGYVNNGPQHMQIDESEIEDDMSDDDLKELLYQNVQDHFEANISPALDTEESEFIAWAREVIESREAEEDE